MNKTISSILYIRRKERKSLIFIVSILLFSSFSDDLYFAITAKAQSPSKIQFISLEEAGPIVPKHLSVTNENAIENSDRINTNNKDRHQESQNNKPTTKDSKRHVTPVSGISLTKHIPTVISDKKPILIDPNTASKEELLEVGVPEFAANNWVKFVNAGAKIYEKSDLEKIYGLTPESINSINAKMLYPNKPARFKKPTLMSFDINEADAFEFSAIPGIGKILSERIVKFRDKLGGFHSPDQLKEVYGIVDSVIENHLEYLEINTEVKMININSGTIKDLSSHPYCNWRAAEIIVNYRKQHGAFSKPEELNEIRAFEKKWVLKISPYLSF